MFCTVCTEAFLQALNFFPVAAMHAYFTVSVQHGCTEGSGIQTSMGGR